MRVSAWKAPDNEEGNRINGSKQMVLKQDTRFYMAALRGDGPETEPPQPKALLFQQTIEVVKPADSPFPAPLEEGISLDTYSAYIEPLPMLDMEQKVGLAMPPPNPHPCLCWFSRPIFLLDLIHTKAR